MFENGIAASLSFARRQSQDRSVVAGGLEDPHARCEIEIVRHRHLDQLLEDDAWLPAEPLTGLGRVPLQSIYLSRPQIAGITKHGVYRTLEHIFANRGVKDATWSQPATETIDSGRSQFAASLAQQVFIRLTLRFTATLLDLGFNLLSLVECAKARALHCRDVNEYISTATSTALRLNETVALLRVEPLHGACRHFPP
jgi:hypothetical protein